MGRNKITVVGAGNVGASVAAYASAQELGDVVVIDILEGVPQGKGLDMWEATPVLGVDTRVIGTNQYEMTEGSDLVIITAGIARKPGMSRDDLLATNVRIVADVSEKVARFSPDAIIIVVSNPLDAMVYTTWKKSGFHPRRILGMAGVLDTARFRSFLAEEIGVSVEDVHALVLGGHGDTMVPLTRYCFVGGIPVTNFISPDRLEEIVQRTRQGGAEIVNLLKTGSAYYAPAASAVLMAESVLRDKKRLLPVAAYLDGEFNEKGLFVGVPAILGAAGVEKVVELELTVEEQEAFEKSVEAVRSLVKEVDQLL
ncbi:MAG: malate dehydrogenase [Desulfomonile tiedjei]|uniref:Malate dehydrogenase n=1 Tax=Desulfomonile tiedjei TaxID=2358 RepID=A0A9D6V813_9BACT|nr:malate dehydrogenase [Desulfomonile tiedjei]